nr:reverse transcriptase domain-containing protein [Tanacetum cinerariifolium]
MGYEHFSTTLVTELDEVTESSIKNLVPIPREYEVTSDNESESNKPDKDDSLAFTTFSIPVFNDSDDFKSNDEDVPIEESKVYSNPLFDNDEINSDELESHVEYNFVESLSNHDTLVDSSQKIDYLEEFSGPLIRCNYIRGESDFYSEEIEIFLNDDSIPIGVENSVFDPEGDILYLERLLSEDPSLSMNLNQAKSSIEEPEYSFSMGYEHFSTTLVTELDEVTESSIKNLVPIPREYEVTSDNEKEDLVCVLKVEDNLSLVANLFKVREDLSLVKEDVAILVETSY